MKRFAKIMFCVSLCLSMMVPPISAEEINESEYPYGYSTKEVTYPVINKYGVNKYVIIYIEYRSKKPITATKLNDNQVTLHFDGGYIFRGATGHFYDSADVIPELGNWTSTGSVNSVTDKVIPKSLSYDKGGNYQINTYQMFDITHDIKFDDGTVLFEGTNSDNPPQPDVPTAPSWMEQLGSVWNPQWMIIIIGSTVLLVALGGCLMWLVRRLKRLSR